MIKAEEFGEEEATEYNQHNLEVDLDHLEALNDENRRVRFEHPGDEAR